MGSSKKHKIAIVLPTYNERKNLARLVREIFRFVAYAKLIIVDDNSPDGTGEVADELAKKYDIKVIHRKGKLGLSSAVAEGFKHARTDIIGVMDSDLSHPPEVIPKLLKEMLRKDADIAIGSRNIEGGSVEVWTFYRKLVSRVATVLAMPLTRVKDPLSGFFFLRRKVINGVRINSRGYKILLEILVKGKYAKAVEVPYVFRDRSVGQSKLNYKQYWLYLWDLARLYCHKSFQSLAHSIL